MKKCLLIVMALLFSCSVFAQSVLLGPIASTKNTWLLNKNVSQYNAEQDYLISGSSDYGLSATFIFGNEFLGLGFELLDSKYKQRYRGKGNLEYRAQTEIKSIDLPLLVKFIDPKHHTYVDMGVMWSFVNSVTYTTTENYTSTHVMESDVLGNTTSFFKKTNFSLLFGVGSDIPIAPDLFYLNFGFRIGYGTSDFRGTDALGNDLNNNILYDENVGIYEEYKPTHTLYGSFFFGFKFRIGSSS
jgi:hypothetical protein